MLGPLVLAGSHTLALVWKLPLHPSILQNKWNCFKWSRALGIGPARPAARALALAGEVSLPSCSFQGVQICHWWGYALASRTCMVASFPCMCIYIWYLWIFNWLWYVQTSARPWYLHLHSSTQQVVFACPEGVKKLLDIAKSRALALPCEFHFHSRVFRDLKNPAMRF